MTDLELMESAAKAAGIEVHRGEKWQSGMLFRAIPRPSSPLVANVEWNPLTDDGDALRLAVALRIDVDFGADKTVGAWSHDCYSEDLGTDPAAATRRAIVRAAAAMTGEGGKP